MKPLSEPPRLSDPGSEAPKDLRALLDRAHDAVPTDADLARLARRLPTGPPPPRKPPLTGSAVLLFGVLAGVAVWLAVRSESAAPPARLPPRVEVGPEDEAPTAIEAPAPVDVLPAPPPPAQSASRRPAPRPPGAVPSADTPSTRARPSDVPPPATPAPPHAAQTAAARAVTEVGLLARARRELGGNPAEALRLTAEHARLFPSGALLQEREVLAIEALWRLTRRAEARARAERFLTRYPGSPHRRRVESLPAP